MTEYGQWPKDFSNLQHQTWLFAQVRAEYAALCAKFDSTQKLIEQSRKTADEAWRTLQQPAQPLLPGQPAKVSN